MAKRADTFHEKSSGRVVDDSVAAFHRPVATPHVSAEPIAPLGDILHRVALTVNSSLELKEILRTLSELALEAIPADRCHLFLLDESGTKLVPTFSSGRVTDLRLWQRFRAMEPIDLKEVPARWQAFCAGRAMAIPDMAASALVPAEIVDVFGSRSSLVVPLVAAGEPLGLFSVDWLGPGQDLSYEDLELAEAIGAYAALAIRNARLYEKLNHKALELERLVGVAGALNSKLSLQSVLDLICEAFEELLGTTHCSVITSADGAEPTIRTLAMRGVAWFTDDPETVRAVSPKEIARVRKLWKRSPQPVLYPSWEEQEAVDRSLIPATVRSAALFPLVSSETLHGFVLAGFPAVGGPGAEALENGHALAEQAATAIGRAALYQSVQSRLRRLEVLYRLSDVISGSTGITAALRKLNKVLKDELGIEIRSVVAANSKIRDAVGALPPDEQEMEAIRSWRAMLAKPAELEPRRVSPDALLVPIVHRSRLQGVLRVTVTDHPTPEDFDLLSAIASGCAEIVYKATLHRAIGETERALAVSAERDRIARDLHDSVGQLLTGMALHLRNYIVEAPTLTWRERFRELHELTARGRNEIRETIHSLLFLEVRKRGLVKSIKDLASKFEATTGIQVTVKVAGTIEPLTISKEDALFRVVYEALMNVERHSRASFVTIVIAYRKAEASVNIRDDGIGLAHRDPFRSGNHYGLRSMQQALEEVGGRLEVRNASPRGVDVEGRVPRGVTQGKIKARNGSSRNR